jgi:hypothetical protein
MNTREIHRAMSDLASLINDLMCEIEELRMDKSDLEARLEVAESQLYELQSARPNSKL